MFEVHMKDCFHLSPKKGDLLILNNYRSITLTVIAAKVYCCKGL